MKKRRGRDRFVGGHSLVVCTVFQFLIFFFSVVPFVCADLGPENVLILVNSDSATSQYIARMYREYYPTVSDIQVLDLSGLPDCSGPASTAADEIITRDVYNTYIAEPVRQHLIDNNLLDQVMVVVTTAGMPYRIEDQVYDAVVDPHGSDHTIVEANPSVIDAASVESELACLWVCDYDSNSAEVSNRIVNPYQGYRGSSITLFPRLGPGAKTYTWNLAVTSPDSVRPRMEGQQPMVWPKIYGTINRQFSAGDMYLTCRLDGPKTQGRSAVFAVRQILERSKRASTITSGVNPAKSTVVIDDCPSKSYDLNRIYNLDGSMNYYTYSSTTRQPPNARTMLTMDDYDELFNVLSNGAGVDPTGLNIGSFDTAYGLKTVFDCRNLTRTSQNDLGADERLLYYCCYGVNGDEGNSVDYLLNGLNGEALFDVSNGAIFTSIESFNALTMFSDLQTAPVAQGKIIDFISIGGSGAIGHAFEPMSSAGVDNAYVAYNLFADADEDGYADLTFVEAAFTGIPFLSWSEVVIGDPLMRIAYGPGEDQAWVPVEGDVNFDGYVNNRDLRVFRRALGTDLYSEDPQVFADYDDLCDFNGDGYVNNRDLRIFRAALQ